MEIFIKKLDTFFADLSSFMWGTPLLILLLGGGIYFLFYSRFIPFFYFIHAINILRGKYDDKKAKGQITHFQALTSALSATVGLGNISGVAVAIVTGGPGAIFWMWICAIVGMATKYFTCTLAVVYRKEESDGNSYGGPMYIITKGLGEKWKPLAVFFCLAGLIGTLPLLQANQLTQTFIDVLDIKTGNQDLFYTRLGIGAGISLVVSMVIFGGIKRIGSFSEKMVPIMVVLYFCLVVSILVINSEEVLPSIALIFEDAFTGKAVMGGAVGSVIITGVRRAAFSNEAGMGTAPMMHGAVKTKEPVREGLVAMLGPFIDTLVVCTLTAMAILVTGAWKTSDENGISVTLNAFSSVFPVYGEYLLLAAILVFAISTLLSYSYYGILCLGFLTSPKYGQYYNILYVASIILACVIKLETVINIIDSAFPLMAIPTILTAIILSPKVMTMTKDYFSRLKDFDKRN